MMGSVRVAPGDIRERKPGNASSQPRTCCGERGGWWGAPWTVGGAVPPTPGHPLALWSVPAGVRADLFPRTALCCPPGRRAGPLCSLLCVSFRLLCAWRQKNDLRSKTRDEHFYLPLRRHRATPQPGCVPCDVAASGDRWALPWGTGRPRSLVATVRCQNGSAPEEQEGQSGSLHPGGGVCLVHRMRWRWGPG